MSNSDIKPGSVYWLHSRTFIAAKIGTKRIKGLVIEADGLHAHQLHVDEAAALRPATYKGSAYPAPKLRGHLRRLKPATAGARQLREALLAKTCEGETAA